MFDRAARVVRTASIVAPAVTFAAWTSFLTIRGGPSHSYSGRVPEGSAGAGGAGLHQCEAGKRRYGPRLGESALAPRRLPVSLFSVTAPAGCAEWVTRPDFDEHRLKGGAHHKAGLAQPLIGGEIVASDTRTSTERRSTHIVSAVQGDFARSTR